MAKKDVSIDAAFLWEKLALSRLCNCISSRRMDASAFLVLSTHQSLVGSCLMEESYGKVHSVKEIKLLLKPFKKKKKTHEILTLTITHRPLFMLKVKQLKLSLRRSPNSHPHSHALFRENPATGITGTKSYIVESMLFYDHKSTSIPQTLNILHRKENIRHHHILFKGKSTSTRKPNAPDHSPVAS